jgi:hypothetical protein
MTDVQVAELDGLVAEIDKAIDSVQGPFVQPLMGHLEAARTIANRLRNQAVLRNQATPPVRGE